MRRPEVTTASLNLPTSRSGTQVRSVAAASHDCLPTVRSPQGRRAPNVRDTLKEDPERPVRAKFRELAAAHLTQARMDAIEAAVDRCEDWRTMAELIEPLRQHAI